MCMRDDSVSGDRKWAEPSRSSGLLLMYISLINDAKGKNSYINRLYIVVRHATLSIWYCLG